MKVRRLLVLTALVSSILGAIVVYLFLTVPNDLKADSLLKEARGHIAARRTDQAHDTLVRVIQQYPRTDAAAAATVALVNLEEQQRERIEAELGKLKEDHAANTKAITEIRTSVETLTKAPAKPPAVEAPAKTAPAKKQPAKKQPPTRRRKR